MKIPCVAMSVLLSFSALSGVALADNGKHVGQRHDFTRDVTRTNGAGKTITSHTEQVVDDNGFTRTTDKTGPNGQTAHREVVVNVDKSNHTVTKERTSVGFNGKTHSSTVVKTLGGGK